MNTTVSEPQRIARKIASRIMGDFARNGFSAYSLDFEAKFYDLEPPQRLEVIRELCRRGVLPPYWARKRSFVPAYELVNAMCATVKELHFQHTSDIGNRRIPFDESPAYLKATAEVL